MAGDFAQRILTKEIKHEMETSYLTYSMSVIVGRALPDVRDGLKPVQRRILYAMYESGNTADKPFRKSAKTVGDVLSKYHPHGDAAVYDTMVRMAQDFVLRYPLVEGQGNFGSIDGDPPAAMRYTEARLSRLAHEMLADIEKNTVDFEDNYDNSEKEPTVLPSRFPNLLVNGSTGIAVGMATNIPPHNLGEVIDGIIRLIDQPDISIEELNRIIKGPDFPTGALILGHEGIRRAYQTGKGSITLRARTQIETLQNGRNRIVVTELPYGVNKAKLIERIAELHRDRKIDGITDLRDESDRSGLRIAIELRRDANPHVILNQLFKYTALQQNFGIIMLALVENRPRLLNLKQMLHYYLQHQLEVIVRRTQFDLQKALDRAHILEGLLKALDIIDEVINTIRSSPTTDEARSRLMSNFGFTEVQAQHILDMQLRRLTALEREKLQEEYDELQDRIAYYRAVLASEKMQYDIIKQELGEIKKKYGDPRRTRITPDDGDIDIEDLIADEDVVVTISHSGYIKRVPLSTYRQQRRGGRGVQGAGTKEEDFIEHIFTTTTHHDMMFFTDQGRVYRIRCHEIPEASRQARGTAIVNLIPLLPGEKVNTVIPVKEGDQEEGYIFFATRSGWVKKTAVTEFQNVRSTGIIAIKLEEGDTLVGARLTRGNDEIILVSSAGYALRFHEDDVRPMGRDTRGVKGITLGPDEYVVGMDGVVPGADLLVVSETGVGKRTPLTEYPTYKRGARGVITIQLLPERHGRLVGVKAVTEGNDLMLVSEQGVLIRIPVEEVRRSGRNTQGVQLMNLDANDRVSAVAQVVTRDEE
ncbi:DNA gyrase subunit A [Symbiobacterium thermophilum]|uniref:DNA gyrase subunit A n=2 Tax=Symbiobacterium thermophilum TaxID=2734 RepID=Q67TK1_SYMTH|nr:DNA gyrase subunit A [Symbiobacterium thermophilum]BAD38992.1 DNA gyrase A subunit [Symbiobacterium thermophilum IAM 14863]